MTHYRTPKQLSKFLSYVLGRKPDEFGLVLDPDGFAKIKDVLKAVNEESGYTYVRRSHIHEILMTLPNPSIEIKDNHIRAKHREKLPKHTLAHNIPRLLYTCIRRKAHLFVIENGIFPLGYSRVILSSDRSMAERIGKRTDQMPIVLTVHTQKSIDEGIVFYQAGDTLYLAESILPGCFSGPPLPKQKPVSTMKKTPDDREPQRLAGSFLLELKDDKGQRKVSERKNKTKAVAWKKGKKKMRKQKLKREPPQWRR